MSGKQRRIEMKAKRSADRAQYSQALGESQVVVDEESHNFRLTDAEAEANVRGNKDTIFTVFHAREARQDIEKRVKASLKPFYYSDAKRTADDGMYRYAVFLL
jgi:hypothetical protein